MTTNGGHDLKEIVTRVHIDMAAHIGRGRVADYIPALARIDPCQFGIAIAANDGRTAAAGHAETPFSIQSISKVFTLALALEMNGSALWQRVGREPSGSRFNSIVQLEQERGIPRNPLINAGALVVTDALMGAGAPRDTIDQVTAFLRRLADDPSIAIDEEVAASEADTGFRNASLAYFLRANGNLCGAVEEVLSVYFHQCALRMNCRQLARAGLFLANDGVDPLSGHQHSCAMTTRSVNALMMTCGHYDASGDFAFRVGIPGKSGVGGGILAIAPGLAAIAVWSPGLNAAGNSEVGALALERLVALTGWSVF